MPFSTGSGGGLGPRVLHPAEDRRSGCCSPLVLEGDWCPECFILPRTDGVDAVLHWFWRGTGAQSASSCEGQTEWVPFSSGSGGGLVPRVLHPVQDRRSGCLSPLVLEGDGGPECFILLRTDGVDALLHWFWRGTGAQSASSCQGQTEWMLFSTGSGGGLVPRVLHPAKDRGSGCCSPLVLEGDWCPECFILCRRDGVDAFLHWFWRGTGAQSASSCRGQTEWMPFSTGSGGGLGPRVLHPAEDRRSGCRSPLVLEGDWCPEYFILLRTDGVDAVLHWFWRGTGAQSASSCDEQTEWVPFSTGSGGGLVPRVLHPVQDRQSGCLSPLVVEGDWGPECFILPRTDGVDAVLHWFWRGTGAQSASSS
ncbi:hypothetical protein NDU88_003503 [Pleurodeles waltl]|uniref:Uncharacterized protein n=1 Tax=Pleurodeles waltl TaxID=8319 RepID=A0AAV7QFT9_PLEWA|nr:hypothetical protein NDU88_003503 [Pleurodeles waltl]